MQSCLLYEDPSGFLKIVVPRGDKWASLASQEEFIKQLHDMAIPDCVEFLACKMDALPKDRTFRGAWMKGSPKNPIIIDLEKSKEIHRQRLKEACQRKIDELTKQMVLAFEKSNLPEAVAIGRTTQILHKIPEVMDMSHCKNVQDIKYSIPRELFDVWDFYNPIP